MTANSWKVTKKTHENGHTLLENERKRTQNDHKQLENYRKDTQNDKRLEMTRKIHKMITYCWKITKKTYNMTTNL